MNSNGVRHRWLAMKAESPPGSARLEDYVASPIAPWKTGGDAYHQMVGTLYDYWACWTTCAIADLSIADHLAGESLTAAEVGARAGSAPETTLRLMRAGVAMGTTLGEERQVGDVSDRWAAEGDRALEFFQPKRGSHC